MLPTPNTSPQREVLLNCTNVTSEPFHSVHKLLTPPSHGLVKRSRPANDGGARPKRLKFTIGESRTGEEDEEENGVDSYESEEDSSTALCNVRRKRTIFHARNALAMSRPGTTCRPLPCKPSFIMASFLSLTDRSTDPLTTPRLCIISQDRCVHMQFGPDRFILYTAVRLRIHQRYVPPLRSTSVSTTGLIAVSRETWFCPPPGRRHRTGQSVHLGHVEARRVGARSVKHRFALPSQFFFTASSARTESGRPGHSRQRDIRSSMVPR